MTASAWAALLPGVLVGAAWLVATRRSRAPARRGRRAVLRRSRGTVPQAAVPAALVIDVVAAALEGGAAPAGACRSVAAALRAVWPAPAGRDLADGLDRLAAGRRGEVAALEVLERALTLAAVTGLAPADLVRQGTAEGRRRAAERTAAVTGRLPILLVLPAGLCMLPAALLLGVVPVILDLLAQSLA